MADVTLSEAISLIEGYGEKVAKAAASYMGEYIQSHARKGYATGTLAGSVRFERRSQDTWAVGPAEGESVGDHPYAAYVDEGRGEVHPRPGNPTGRLHYFDTKLNVWLRPEKTAKMDGIHFIDATKTYLEELGVDL